MKKVHPWLEVGFELGCLIVTLRAAFLTSGYQI